MYTCMSGGIESVRLRFSKVERPTRPRVHVQYYAPHGDQTHMVEGSISYIGEDNQQSYSQ